MGLGDRVIPGVVPCFATLDDAHALYEWVASTLEQYDVSVVDGVVMEVREGNAPVGRWNLMGLAGRAGFAGDGGGAALLRSLGFDPASSSAPLVATLVDIMGLVIYFNVARLWLAGAGL